MHERHGSNFHTHDVGILSEFCNRVLSMYAGRVVESGSTSNILTRPKHPYNQALQRSIPSLQAKGKMLHTIAGLPPNLSKPIHGCADSGRVANLRGNNALHQ